jgi:hypothetical protein
VSRILRVLSASIETNSRAGKRVLLFSFSVAFLIYVAAANSSRVNENAWLSGEWLISYEGGFHRRGLAGSAILAVSDLTGAGLLWVVFVVQVLLLLGVLVLLFIKLTSQPIPLGILVALFNPMAVTYFLVDPGGVVGRKEYALFLIAVLWFGFQSKNLHSSKVGIKNGISLLFFAIAIGALVLTHEGLSLFLPLLVIPWLLAWISGEKLSRNWILPSVLTLVIPTVSALTAILVLSSNPSYKQLCDPLTSRLIPERICEGGIYVSVKSGVSGLEYSLSQTAAFVPGYGLYFAVGTGCLIVSYLALRCLPSMQSRLRPTYIAPLTLVFLVALSTPLYVIAVDWGRFISISATLISLGLLFSYSNPEFKGGEFLRLLAWEWPSPKFKTRLLLALAIIWLFFGVQHYAGGYLSIAYTWAMAAYTWATQIYFALK